MNLPGVEKRDAGVTFFSQDQRQLRAGKRYPFDAVIGFHSIDDRQKFVVRLRKKNSGHELSKIFFVDVILICRFRCNQLDPVVSKYLLIETRLHGVACSKKGETL